MLTNHHEITEEEIQNPQGIKKPHQKKTVIQNPQGISTDKQNNSYVTLREAFEDLDIDDIIPFTDIPDYQERTTSPHPIVVRSPNTCHAIDGFDLVAEAKARNETTVTCHVYYIPQFSAIEVAIRKAGIREVSTNGPASYAELARNARHVYSMIHESTENLVVYSHGGTRRGVTFVNNREDNIRILLAERLGKSPSTVSKYVTYTEYLSDEAMETLAQSRTSKSFFQTAASNKNITVKLLRGDNKSDEEVTQIVSEKVLAWLQEYKETEKEGKGKIAPVIYERATTEKEKDRCNINMPGEFEHETPSGEVDNEEPTEDEIYIGLKTLGETLVLLESDRSKTLNKLAEEVRVLICNVSLIHQSILDLINKQQTAADKEVK